MLNGCRGARRQSARPPADAVPSPPIATKGFLTRAGLPVRLPVATAPSSPLVSAIGHPGTATPATKTKERSNMKRVRIGLLVLLMAASAGAGAEPWTVLADPDPQPLAACRTFPVPCGTKCHAICQLTR